MCIRRRYQIDQIVAAAAMEIAQIAEEMDLLAEDILCEVRAALNDNGYLRKISKILRRRNPDFINIAIKEEDDSKRVILFFKDRSAQVITPRRTLERTVSKVLMTFNREVA